jgi:hypothetical protein
MSPYPSGAAVSNPATSNEISKRTSKLENVYEHEKRLEMVRQSPSVLAEAQTAGRLSGRAAAASATARQSAGNTAPNQLPVAVGKTRKEALLTAQMKKLSPVQLGAFEKIFKKFDLENTGTLTAEELHKCINQLAGYNALSRRDVMHILSELDVKGTGDIEFDEFIYFMTRPQNLEKMLTDDDRKHIEKQTGVAMKDDQSQEETRNSRKEPGTVLFNILQRVLEQENNTELRNFYRQQILNKMDDNVIHEWSDGKRCIGLADTEIMRRYKEIALRYRRDQSFKQYLDSPYAKPNKWGIAELKRNIKSRKTTQQHQQQLNKGVKKNLERVKVRQMEITVDVVPLPTYPIQQRQRKFSYDDLSEIRQNVATIKKSYYGYLKEIAANNAKKFHGALGIKHIKSVRNRLAVDYAFESYCNPFVVSPWVPKVNPTSWQNSALAPIGKAIPADGQMCRSWI